MPAVHKLQALAKYMSRRNKEADDEAPLEEQA